MRFVSILVFSIFLYLKTFAQHEVVSIEDSIDESIFCDTSKSCTLADFIHRSKMFGHIRNFTMSTINQGELSDHFANAIGASLGFETPVFHNFQFGLMGIFTFRLASTPIWEKDHTANKPAVFETQLFDIEEPENGDDLDRLDDIYLRYYTGKKGYVQMGRFSINSPLINPQDGRMKPYAFQGIWTSQHIGNKFLLGGGFISHISPRSTVRYMKVEESFGIYNQGLSTNGNLSNYRNNTETNGILIAGLEYKSNPNHKTQIWQYYVDNVNYTAFFQSDHEHKLANSIGLITGIQAFYQTETMNQHHDSNSKEDLYVDENWNASGISGQIGIRIGNNKITTSLLRISNSGRFLFPMEWGREQFYSTLARGRVEGMGNIWLPAIKYTYKKEHLDIRLEAAQLISNDNKVELNKYNLHPYTQVNLDATYHFEGFFEGLSARILLVSKLSSNNKDLELKNYYYKSNFFHSNFILNYEF